MPHVVFMLQVSVLVEQDSQRPILLGRQGSQLKKLATDSRRAIEEFLGQWMSFGFCHISLAYSIPTCFSQADDCPPFTIQCRLVCKIDNGVFWLQLQVGRCSLISQSRWHQSGGRMTCYLSNTATEPSSGTVPVVSTTKIFMPVCLLSVHKSQLSMPSRCHVAEQQPQNYGRQRTHTYPNG